MEMTKYTKEKDIERSWYLVDASGKTVGRLATEIATRLRGKNKPYYTPSVDCGDFVVVTNAEGVSFTGAKWTDKKYYRHTGYPGGLKYETAEGMKEKHPDFILRNAVKGMLPKTKLGRKMLKKLKIYVGSQHPHEAQNPKKLDI